MYVSTGSDGAAALGRRTWDQRADEQKHRLGMAAGHLYKLQPQTRPARIGQCFPRHGQRG